MHYKKTISSYIILLFSLTLISCKNKKKVLSSDEIETISYTIPYQKINEADKQNWKKIIEQFYNGIMKPKLNGQFLVAKNGEILYEAYNGNEFLKKDSSKPMNEHSAIHLASTSKTLTAGAILLLSQQKKLHLDDTVSKYLTQFPYKDVTIKMLLNHRAGLPDYTHLLWDWGWPKNAKASNNDVLNYMVSAKALQVFKTNTMFDYCNTNYVMLALLVEKISGLSFPKFMQKHIFKPLQMNDSYVFEPKDTATAIISYDRRFRPYEYNELDLTYGDKNIYSTVKDLLKWDQVWYTNKLIDDEHKALAFTAYSNEKPGVKNYGLGWRMNIYDNEKKIVFHNGWWHGNNNAFIRLFQDSATFICLGNVNAQSNYAPMELSGLFGDYPFGHEKEDKTDTTGQAQLLLMNVLKQKVDSLKLITKPVQKQKKDSSNKKIDTSKMILQDEKKKKKDSVNP
jgi:CubicO group peptidase (beta-lactamase class C family)